MNVIFTYKPLQELPEDAQTKVDKVIFIEIPEMKRLLEELEGMQVVTIPYQANIDDLTQFESLKTMLSNYGEVDIVGVWDDSGEIIQFSLEKYCNLLKPMKKFEEAVFINGVDFTGRESEFQPTQKKDENDELMFQDGEPIYELPMYKRFTREISSIAPTLEEAKHIHVNVFNANFKRKLDGTNN